jgi:hypothetical protein
MKKKEKQWKRIIKRVEKRNKTREPEIISKGNKKFTNEKATTKVVAFSPPRHPYGVFPCFHDKEINKLFMPIEVEVIEE